MEEHASQPSLLDPGVAEPGAVPSWAGVAGVAIDSPLPHLDHLFDYGIPPEWDATAQVGARVRIRFAGKNVDGFIITRASTTTRTDLQPIRRVLGEHPVLTAEILRLCSDIAARYAGGLADVLRLAVPPRHATAEKRVLAEVEPPSPGPPVPTGDDDAWHAYRAGPAFLERLRRGQSPRAVWSALPTPEGLEPPEWARAIVAATRATLESGRGVLILAPTSAPLEQIVAALRAADIDHVELTAELGPSTRYSNFLKTLLGRTPVVVGTRAAAYAPVADLGLIVCWDEAHDSYSEPRAPYPHAREALALRASLAGAGALFGGYARSTQAEHLVTSGWAHHLGADRATVRRRTPRIRVADEFDRMREGAVGHARIPSFAWTRITKALATGPVLLQVPRAGFTPSLACGTCRHTARCTECHGPLAASSAAPPRCTWCGAAARDWSCPHCQGEVLRARTVGAGRTAEELGRAFPGIPVKVSGRGAGRLEPVGDRPALIVATPGAEPPAAHGYQLAVLLDAGFLTDLPFLNAPISALHRWLHAAALTTGEVLILGDPLTAPAQAAVRWDPSGYARRELAEWAQLGFPPSHTVVTVTGERADVMGILRHLPQVPTLRSMGPVAAPAQVHRAGEGELAISVAAHPARLLLRVDAEHHLALTEGVRSAVRIRSARREGRPVVVRVNPIEEL